MKIQLPNLRLLRPPTRLLFVATLTSGLLLLNDLYIIVGIAALSFTLFAFSPKRPWRGLILIVFPTMLLYFVGNLIFSPPEYDGYKFWVFRINAFGIQLAVARSLRIGAILLISLAWLSTTPVTELYESFSPFRRIEPWALSIARGLQLSKREFTLIGQSLRIRGMRLETLFSIMKSGRWKQLRENVRTFLALLRIIIPRQLTRISKATLAWERHHPEPFLSKEATGTVAVQELFIRYSSKEEPKIHNAHFFLNPGQFTYLIGRAGSGKTSLLMALGGIIPRVVGELAGRIDICGFDTTNLRLRQYATLATYVDSDSESNVLGLTVGQEMGYLSKDEDHAKRCLSAIGIEDLWDRETTKLSGGEQVRLLIAGILASQSPVLLLDSPLDQLDPQGQLDFEEALSSLLHEDHKTIIVSDSHFEKFETRADLMLAIDKGIVNVIKDLERLSSALDLKEWGLQCSNIQTIERKARNPNRVALMEDVMVTIDDITILHGISLYVNEGELVAIQGPNGSGKTTAMLTLAGAIKPNAGSVLLDGHAGYLFQDPSYQIVAPTAYEEIALAPRLRGYEEPQIRDVVNERLNWVGINGSQSPLYLHYQDMKLLALAAMSIDVKLLILDEPTVGLDAFGVEKVIQIVDRLLQDKVGIVIISHESSIVDQADRTIRFEHGKCS